MYLMERYSKSGNFKFRCSFIDSAEIFLEQSTFLKTEDKRMETYTQPSSRYHFELPNFVPELEDRKYRNIKSNCVSVPPLSTNLIFSLLYKCAVN